MKGTYSQEVDVEKVEFTNLEKSRLEKGDVAFGGSARMRVTESGNEFFTNMAVNNQMEIVEEGSVIITFPGGLQKLLSAEEAKESLKISSKKTEKVADEAAKVVVQTTAGTQKILDDKTSANLLKEEAK